MDPLNPIPYEIEVRGSKEELYPLYMFLVFGYFFILVGVMLMTRRGLILHPGVRH